VNGLPFVNSGSRQFIPPGKNGDGDTDWLLVLEASYYHLLSVPFAGAAQRPGAWPPSYRTCWRRLAASDSERRASAIMLKAKAKEAGRASRALAKI
jgi:hypothetical protein